MPGQKPKPSKKEVALAVGAGILATTIAFAVMDEGVDVIEYSEPAAIVADAPNELVYELDDFTEIFTNGPQDVVVTYGDEFSVRSEGSPRALATLEATVSDGRLTIAPPDDFNFGNWRMLQDATFYVTLPRLDTVSLTGYGDMRIDRVETDSFTAIIAGTESTLNIADMQVDEAEITIAGSGEITVAGIAREAQLFIGGAGNIDASQLFSETASITVGGSGDVGLSVADEAQVTIMGRGEVDIFGDAECSVMQMGAGDVDCGLPSLADLPDNAEADAIESDAPAPTDEG